MELAGLEPATSWGAIREQLGLRGTDLLVYAKQSEDGRRL